MQHPGKIFFFLLILSQSTLVFAQRPQFSLATDFSVQRSFKKQQRYWSIGQTVSAQFHFTPKDGAYAWLCYYTNGKFSNELSAAAKSVITTPQSLPYTNRAQLSFRQVSLGWKHYLKGSSNSEENLNIYGLAGLGLLLGRIENTHSVNIDTTQYTVPVLEGKANFKRLTFDLGLGIEQPVGGDIYLYVEGKVFIPSSGYPSNYLFINKDAPLATLLNIGFRILFGN